MKVRNLFTKHQRQYLSELCNGVTVYELRKKLRDLRDEMQPLLSTWRDNWEDELKLNAVEQEVRVVGIAYKCRGKVRDEKTVNRILEKIMKHDVCDWLEGELNMAECAEREKLRAGATLHDRSGAATKELGR